MPTQLQQSNDADMGYISSNLKPHAFLELWVKTFVERCGFVAAHSSAMEQMTMMVICEMNPTMSRRYVSKL